MKKIAGLLSLLTIISIMSACSKIEKSTVDYSYDTSSPETSITLQSESPMPDTSIDTSETTTETSSETTQTTTTKKKVTSTSKPTTTTTQTPVVKPPVSPSGYSPINYDVQKGVWISYIDAVIISSGKTEAQYRQTIALAFQNVKNIGVNTVYVHVRSHGDAYYNSNYFPKSIKTSKDFDQLKVMIEEAHKLGLSFHAWINPFRGPLSTNIDSIDNSYLIKQWYNDPVKKGKYISEINGTYYLNPGYPEVRQLIINGVAEIVSKYNVDAIHFDDYFYPTTASSFDTEAYSIYGGGKSLADWRRSNVDEVVSGVYRTVKSINSRVLFGVSPQGNNSNNYNSQYANVSKWSSNNGYIDYVIPQLYWGFEHSSAPFASKCIEWRNIVKNPNVKLVIGLAPYRIGESGQFDFVTDPNIISKQINYAKSLSGYGGVAFFRYEHLVGYKIAPDINNIKQALQ